LIEEDSVRAVGERQISAESFWHGLLAPHKPPKGLAAL